MSRKAFFDLDGAPLAAYRKEAGESAGQKEKRKTVKATSSNTFVFEGRTYDAGPLAYGATYFILPDNRVLLPEWYETSPPRIANVTLRAPKSAGEKRIPGDVSSVSAVDVTEVTEE